MQEKRICNTRDLCKPSLTPGFQRTQSEESV